MSRDLGLFRTRAWRFKTFGIRVFEVMGLGGLLLIMRGCKLFHRLFVGGF